MQFRMLLNSWFSSTSRSLKFLHFNFHVSDNDRRLGGNNDGYRRDVDLEDEDNRLLSRHTRTFGTLEDERGYRSLMSLGKSTVRQTIVNAVNILMGIAILALPLAFKFSGWVIGLSIFSFCLISTNYTAKILKKCLDTDPECLTYADLAYLAYGQKGKFFVGFLFLMDLYNAAVALMILVGDSLKILFPQVDLIRLKLIVFLIITPITWLPIHYLSYTSILGIFTASSLALVLLIDGLTKYVAPGSLWQPMDTYLFPQNWLIMPLSFGLINSAFSGHAVFPSLYRDMEKPCDYKKSVNSSYLVAGVVYFTVAICGYLMFGSETMQEITQNIMSTCGYSLFLNSIVVWLIVINPLSKYPLTLAPINLSIEVTFFQTRMDALSRSKIVKFLFIIISRSLVSFVIVGTAIVFPGFDRAMSLLGSCFSFLIASICPLLCHLKMFGRYLSKKELIWDLFILVVCSVMAIIGTTWTFLPRELLDGGNQAN